MRNISRLISAIFTLPWSSTYGKQDELSHTFVSIKISKDVPHIIARLWKFLLTLRGTSAKSVIPTIAIDLISALMESSGCSPVAGPTMQNLIKTSLHWARLCVVVMNTQLPNDSPKDTRRSQVGFALIISLHETFIQYIFGGCERTRAKARRNKK